MILKSFDLKELPKNYLTTQISCLFNGFKGSSLAPDLWVQKENGNLGAVILGYGQTAYISYFGGDESELFAFLSALSFKNILTDKKFSFLRILKTNSVFKKDCNKDACDLPEIPSLANIYRALSFGKSEDVSLPDFETFAPDTSHLLRHGFAFSVLSDFGGALVHFDCGAGILKGISVKEESRGLGLGTSLLNSCLKYCPKGLYAATANSGNFYLKNGFLKEPYLIYFGELK